MPPDVHVHAVALAEARVFMDLAVIFFWQRG